MKSAVFEDCCRLQLMGFSTCDLLKNSWATHRSPGCLEMKMKGFWKSKKQYVVVWTCKMNQNDMSVVESWNPKRYKDVWCISCSVCSLTSIWLSNQYQYSHPSGMARVPSKLWVYLVQTVARPYQRYETLCMLADYQPPPFPSLVQQRLSTNDPPASWVCDSEFSQGHSK